MQAVKNLGTLLQAAMKGKPSTIREAVDDSSEIIVFGSRAYGCQTPNSDLDILCIGCGASFHHKDKGLDLLCLSAEDSRSVQWCGSELAGHIAAFGVLLKGDRDLVASVSIGTDAIVNKERRIKAYVVALSGKWLALDPMFRVKYATKLRRELQRLSLLVKGAPIPPTRVLDDVWTADQALPYSNLLEGFAMGGQSVLGDFERTLHKSGADRTVPHDGFHRPRNIRLWNRTLVTGQKSALR